MQRLDKKGAYRANYNLLTGHVIDRNQIRYSDKKQETKQAIGNRVLPQSMDWTEYNSSQTQQNQENTKTVVGVKKEGGRKSC